MLRSVAWTEDAERAFFASGARELPRPEYRIAPEVAEAGERFRVLKTALAGGEAIETFLRETCDAFSTASRMLLAVGTKDFYYHSVELYGRPASLTADRRTTNLDLAQHFAQVVDGVAGTASIPSPADEETLTAEEVQPLLESRFARFFAGAGIGVEIVDGLAAKAAAGVDGVRLQRGARFSQRDLLQLEFHEGHVHVATALNGRAQPIVAFTGYPSPRTTATQEGLAVLTEFLTQSTSLERLRRLSRPHARHQDGRGRRRLLRALPLLPRPRPRRGGRVRLRAARVPRRARHGRRALHEGRLLPRRPPAGDELPARRPRARAPAPRAALLRRQD